MIDAEDFQIPGSGTLKNKLGITDPDALARMATESASRRLAELQESPIRGGFDTSHLQEIHHYLYQDVFDWAGELRRIEKGAGSLSSLEDSLNHAFDRLSRDNLLRASTPRNGPDAPQPTSMNFARFIPSSQAMTLQYRSSPRNSPARTICAWSGRRRLSQLPMRFLLRNKLRGQRSCDD